MVCPLRWVLVAASGVLAVALAWSALAGDGCDDGLVALGGGGGVVARARYLGAGLWEALSGKLLVRQVAALRSRWRNGTKAA